MQTGLASPLNLRHNLFVKTRILCLKYILWVFAVLFWGTESLGISILKIKDGKTLLSLEGPDLAAPPKVGDILFVTDAGGSKKALVQVHQVKDNRAIAHLVKGQLTQEASTYRLQPAPANLNLKEKVTHAWGGLFGFAQNHMKVNVTSATAVAMSGTSFNLEGFYQRQLDGNYQVLGRFGYNSLKAKGTLDTGACVGSSECSTDISYLGFDGLVMYSFYKKNQMTFWGGGGLGFLLPFAKSSNVIDTSKLGLGQKILLDVGMNYYLDAKRFVPVQLEYVIFPNNSVVSSSQIILRAGYGLVF
jgi:hypothetical protein